MHSLFFRHVEVYLSYPKHGKNKSLTNKTQPDGIVVLGPQLTQNLFMLGGRPPGKCTPMSTIPSEGCGNCQQLVLNEKEFRLKNCQPAVAFKQCPKHPPKIHYKTSVLNLSHNHIGIYTTYQLMEFDFSGKDR